MQLVLMLSAAIIVSVFLFGLPFFYFICIRNRYMHLVCAKCHARVDLQKLSDKPDCPGCGIELAADKDLTREYHKLPLIKIYAGYTLIYGLIIYFASFVFEITYDVHYGATILFTIATTWSAFCGALLIIAKTCSGDCKAKQPGISAIAGDLISIFVSLLLYGFILAMLSVLMIAFADKCFPNPRAIKLNSFPDPLIISPEKPEGVSAEKPLAEAPAQTD